MRSLLPVALALVTACSTYAEQPSGREKDDDAEETDRSEVKTTEPAAAKASTAKSRPLVPLQRFACTTDEEIDGAIHRIELTVQDIDGDAIALDGDVTVTPADTRIASINHSPKLAMRDFTEIEGKGTDEGGTYKVTLGLDKAQQYTKGVLWLVYSLSNQLNVYVTCTKTDVP